MGIKNLNAFLKSEAPGAFRKLRLSSLYGHKVAIDANNWVYTRRAVVYKSQVMNMPDPLCQVDINAIIQGVVQEISHFAGKLLQYGVIPVWCFDGKPLPDKEVCREKRAKAKQRNLERIEEAKSRLTSVHPLKRNPLDVTKYKKLLANQNVLAPDEMSVYKAVTTNLGMPTLTAEYEGEKLCANLAREQLAVGAWSSDTDCYPLGAPMTITGFDGMESGVPTVSVVLLHEILNGLQFNHPKFLDFCITLECDFNKNMKGVGPKRTHALFKKYDSIDEIKLHEPHRPIEVLRHLRCREIFQFEPTGYTKYSSCLYPKETQIKEPDPLQLNYHRDILNRLYTQLPAKPTRRRVTVEEEKEEVTRRSVSVEE